jgi:hypothetical protein
MLQTPSCAVRQISGTQNTFGLARARVDRVGMCRIRVMCHYLSDA